MQVELEDRRKALRHADCGSLWLVLLLTLCACSQEDRQPAADAVTVDVSDAIGEDSVADTVSDLAQDTEDVPKAVDDAGSQLPAIADLCPLLAQKQCEALAKCGCPLLEGGVNDCVIKQKGSCDKSVISFAGGVSLGELTYQADLASKCLAGFDTFAASCGPPSNRTRPTACRDLFADKAPLGVACKTYSAGLTCANGAGACNPQAGNACQPLPGDGQPCLMMRCQDGLVCDGTVCQPPSTAGGPCNGDDGCQLPLLCVAGTCASPLPTDATCTSSSQCSSGLACGSGTCQVGLALDQTCSGDTCGAGLACLPIANVSQCAAKAKIGQPCEGFDTCEDGLFCDYVNGSVCKLLPVEGQSCPTQQCADDLSCSIAGTCVVAPDAGQPCLVGASKGCRKGFGCSASLLCVPLSQAGGPCLDGLCAGSAVCDYSASPPQCTAPQSVGNPCVPTAGSCVEGLTCDVVASICVTIVESGGTCKFDSDCGSDAVCAYPDAASGASTGVCQPAPNALGAPCPQGICGGGLRCAPPPGVCRKGICLLN